MLTNQECDFLHELVEAYSHVLEAYSRRVLGYSHNRDQLLQDVLQSVYLKASVHIKKLMRHKNPLGWLLECCHLTILSEVAKERRRLEQPTDASIMQYTKTQRELAEAVRIWSDRVSLEDVIAAADAILSAEENDVFKTYYVGGYSIEETAKRLHISHSTARGRINRMRKKLKRYYPMMEGLLLIILTVGGLRR